MALELVFRHIPYVPHWPQLPQRGRVEHFVYQYLNYLLELGLLDTDRVLHPEAADWVDKLAAFYSAYLEVETGNQEALDLLATPRQAAPGLYAFIDRLSQAGPGEAAALKGQISGPLSVGLNLFDPGQRPVYYDPQLRDLVVKCLAGQARWQVQQLKQFGLPVLLFVDDPAIAAWGSSTYITLDRQEIINSLGEIAAAIHAGGALAGAHSCAGVDWAMFIEAGYDIISFDAYHYFPSLLGYTSQLRELLERGGMLAWGIVPTSDEAWSETAATLEARWQAQFSRLVEASLPAAAMYDQMLITPACGAGLLPVSLAEHIYALTGQLAARLEGRRKG